MLLFPADVGYSGSLNELNSKLLEEDKNYVFTNYFRLNTDLLDLYKKYSPDKKLYVFTSDEIQNHPAIQGELDKVFDEVVSAKHEGILKTDSEAYKFLCHRFGLQPNEVVYIDDQQKNLVAAAKAGLKTIHYTDNQALKSELATSICIGL